MKAKPLFPAVENDKTFLNTLLKAGVASSPHRIQGAESAMKNAINNATESSHKAKKKRHKGAYS
ncbi:hypothetical protein KYT87_05320 [Achromobacter sp. ES-001]|uniref:hypothetical protein n=1 Tax=Achromobacter sp. ES-001 TaxID=2860286 RepID=UPI001C63B8E3|nr:hypothetical protein [Achromobacter sp. ES-001]QYJ22664.1 hypothetical protein KYT87_05320 [Achromobacter sp. ES-001]